MENVNNAGFNTKSVHAGYKKDPINKGLSIPIYQTSTFMFDNCEQGGKCFAGEESGYIYSRIGNPTVTMLEEKLSVLEGAEETAFTSSGMGAISSALWASVKAGDHIVADGTLYGCTFALLAEGIQRFGVEVSFVDASNPENVKKALKENTKVVYLETPANPTLKITDLKAVADLTHAYNKDILVMVDNTFATPFLQQPLALGCDVVVHSATKYLNGHGDVIAGAVCGTHEFINQVKFFAIKDMTGSVIGPFEAFLVIRGLKTLGVRMERHCANGEKVANYLLNHPKVEKVYYPGFESHPNHEVAKKQMSGFGGMIAFEVKGGKKGGTQLLDNVKLCTLAVSLGDTETLIEHPASMTHATYGPEELKEAGIPEGLVRISVGLEDAEDIIADLEQSFATL